MIKPLGDRVLLEIIQTEQPKGGIILSSESLEKPQEGIVISKGIGRILPNGMTAPMQVNVGDRVLFPKYVGIETVISDTKYLILHEKDILAII